MQNKRILNSDINPEKIHLACLTSVYLLIKNPNRLFSSRNSFSIVRKRRDTNSLVVLNRPPA